MQMMQMLKTKVQNEKITQNIQNTQNTQNTPTFLRNSDFKQIFNSFNFLRKITYNCLLDIQGAYHPSMNTSRFQNFSSSQKKARSSSEEEEIQRKLAEVKLMEMEIRKLDKL